MTRRSHRGRRGDGWPKRPSELVLAAPFVRASAIQPTRTPTYPNVCTKDAGCGHVVCAIVWYCVEAAP